MCRSTSSRTATARRSRSRTCPRTLPWASGSHGGEAGVGCAADGAPVSMAQGEPDCQVAAEMLKDEAEEVLEVGQVPEPVAKATPKAGRAAGRPAPPGCGGRAGSDSAVPRPCGRGRRGGAGGARRMPSPRLWARIFAGRAALRPRLPRPRGRVVQQVAAAVRLLTDRWRAWRRSSMRRTTWCAPPPMARATTPLSCAEP
ncbi:unnamed protein product [Prorocentrum cordatum]|uniref:Uncharacterized protein n=1 Tax=Prorocentrum cordatum TaxID=2364126 RepID=A0ABN9R2E1_9DINO|nr:unnamed protein product [Polarella glacialis]